MEKKRHRQLEEYFERYPELRREVDRRRIRDFRLFASGVVLHLEDGGQVRLHPKLKTQGKRDRLQAFFHRLLRSGFPGWRIERVMAGTDRLRHQTAALLRVILSRGPRRLAVVIAYPDEPADLTNRILSAAILWWRRLERRARCERLVILLPEGWSERILLLLPRLRIRTAVYKYEVSDARSLRQIYPRPIESSEVRSPYVMFTYEGEPPGLLTEMRDECPDLDLVYRQNRWELTYLGLRVLWYDAGKKEYLFDLRSPTVWRSSDHPRLLAHIAEVKRMRAFPPPAAASFHYREAPELWLESLILRDHRSLNPDFAEIIYSQVPTCLDGERKILDLLTVTNGGRLAVIELKIQKDLDLVFQGLDYWERVEYHLRNGDFQAAGYFPGMGLSEAPPLLYLVSPLFEYHGVLPLFRHYLRTGLAPFCVGINSDWRGGIRILRRFEL
jgi:hypothetical protein